MKKLIGLLLLFLVILTAILWIRTETVFVDKQLQVQQIERQLPLDKDAVVSRLAKGIQFKTISYDDPKQFDDKPFIDLRRHIQQSYPLVHQIAQQKTFSEHSLLYYFPGTDKTLKPALFMGHMDVVPVDDATLDKWQQPPFSGAVVNDVIWGRGTLDDKVTVFALLESMELLLQQNKSFKRGIYLAFGHDEEIGGYQGAAKIAEYLQDQGIEFEFVLDEGGAITQGIIPKVEQPVAIIGIAEKGIVNLKLTVDSQGGHSSQPPEHSALGILSEAIVNIENNQFDTDLTFSKMTFDAIATYAPMSNRLPMANLWLFEPVVSNVMLDTPSSAASIRTTIAATMASGSSKSNILPSQASAVINFRILPGDTIETVKQHVINAIDDERVVVSDFMGTEPSAVSPTDSFAYKLIEKHIRQQNNEVLVAPYLLVGATDSRYYNALSDNIYRFMMIRLDPDGLTRFHGINEQLQVTDYLSAIRFFHAVLQETSGVSVPLSAN
ncbi:M20 family peptidase [Aliiglaciecola sp. 3_MG-2023]|uniref:M20 family peptidase n=1 Tax=Aliiglaciecola sp. 3_MG-2023 TaxID=3062644 RepID=UPI0026E2A90F|nr:M20 family peptidase [Aliiglaciecola sp. 3_MG-2023]MDO6694334.1 M20 family peptidase [Aliiglaciecola sp. 3_MG-2023]